MGVQFRREPDRLGHVFVRPGLGDQRGSEEAGRADGGPAWETSEDRKRLAVRMAARSPKQFADVTYFHDVLYQIGKPTDPKRE